MKISYSWLKEHLPLELSAQELAGHFPKLGFEVASLEHRGPAFTGVVAAEVLAVGKHPNADRLSLCAVFDGKEKLSVVCGAKNVAAGQKVALARLGAVLPGGHRILPAKIRGVPSQGMICSNSELGLGEDHGGIMVLAPSAQAGTDLAASMGPSDDIFELEITPNRPDCLSHLGLARELSAYLRLPLAKPAAPALPAPEGECLPVEIQSPQACPRYLGRVFTNLKVGPSPAWLAAKLEAVGLRPICNLVDITNLILMDIGQPLHAFDLDKVEGAKIVVRFAAAGERIVALDGKDYALSPSCLAIADAKKPLAIAGVMGGLESSVTQKTSRAFLESAHFSPPVVRKSSQSLRLRSDSSYRFERGTDIAAVATGSERATKLILALCGPEARVSAPRDAFQETARPGPIMVTAKRVNAILGANFAEPEVAGALERISADFKNEGGTLAFTAPSHRADLETPQDLAEEVGRLLGYDNIPSRQAPVPLSPSRPLPSQALAERCRGRLAALGLTEACNYDFISEKALELCGVDPAPFARLANPVSEDWTILRPSLLPGLLQNAAANLNRGAKGARLFELGKVYAGASSGVSEKARVAGVILGPVAETFWKAERCPESGFYDAKGIVEELLANVPAIQWGPCDCGPMFHPAASFGLKTPKGELGAVGLLHPRAARGWKLERENAAIFELDLEALAALEPTRAKFAPYGLFPSSWRDISIVLDAKTPYARVEGTIRGCAVAELSRIELIDVFAGKTIAEGKRSLTLRLNFSLEDRTLTDAEVAAAVEKILSALAVRLGAVLRS